MGDLGLIPGLGRSPGEGNSYPLQYSGLENSMDSGTWQATQSMGRKESNRLSDFHFDTLTALDDESLTSIPPPLPQGYQEVRGQPVHLK